jgi:hypothetical protein
VSAGSNGYWWKGGLRLLADFFKLRCVSEQFLTPAPQIAGRVAGDGRLGNRR